MRIRTLLYLVLWIILAFLLFRSCQPKNPPPGESPAGFRPESFDPADRPPEETVVLETDLLWMEWSRRGAGVTRIRLKDFSADPGHAEEIPEEDWLEVYRSVPAYPPPPGYEAGIENHRRRDALRLWEPEGVLKTDLDSADWEVERHSNRDYEELVFSLDTASGVHLVKRVRAFPGQRHLLVQLEAANLEPGLPTYHLRFQMGTGGGMLRVQDRFYPNPYAAAARMENGRVAEMEKYIPMGALPPRRDAAVRWNGEFAFIVEGSKYILNAIRPLGAQPAFQQVVVEALYDHQAYTEVMRKGLNEEQFRAMAAVANAEQHALDTRGVPASPAELAAASGLSEEEAVALRAAYVERNRQAVQVLDKPWRRASISGAFTLDVVKAGESPRVKPFQWYLGPKDPAILGSEAYRPLDAVIGKIDYGGSLFYDLFFTRYIAPGILGIIRLFHLLTGNWGVAIILMTVLVRGLLFPLNRRGQVKMAAYQQKTARVKPQLEAIKKKYADNPQKRNEETMKVYKEHKLSPPLGGCLPMLLQFPVFIGLFAALRCSILLRQQPFFGWIRDLSRPDALIDFGGPVLDFWPLSGVTTLNILPILMVVLWVLHQRSMPRNLDPQQAQMQKMMTFMPVLFGLLLYNYAAGLSLYMITSSSIGIFESRVIKKHWPVALPAAHGKPATG